MIYTYQSSRKILCLLLSVKALWKNISWLMCQNVFLNEKKFYPEKIPTLFFCYKYVGINFHSNILSFVVLTF